jgi:3-hydroxyisobutyrate dehydrogenase-like beta-hydroxyacid dehydrogenase
MLLFLFAIKNYRTFREDTDMSESIGFVGLGKMGQPIARNLLKAGYTLRVYNRDARKAETLVADGAQQVSHPSEVVEPGGIVITMVADDSALESVMLGKDGILEHLGPGGIHISMSTVSPAIARCMTILHAQHSCTYVAAPVFGRPEAAMAKKLWICLAGATAAKERIQPILHAIGQGVFDFGEDPPMANVVKLCGNFLIGSALEAMAEALTLAEKNGLDRETVINMFGQSIFACPIYQNYGSIIAEKRFTPVGFEMRLALKDMNLLLDTAEQATMAMPFGSLVHDRLLTGVAKGRGTMDWTALAQLVAEDAGID